jgi:hypothetical protein
MNLDGGWKRTSGKLTERHVIIDAQTRLNNEAASTGGNWTHVLGSNKLRAALQYLLVTNRSTR